MKAPIVGKIGQPVPDGYEPLYCGRTKKYGGPSKWCNPFEMNGNSEAERKRVIDQFVDYMKPPNGAKLHGDLGELTGKFLQCHCAPKACHCDHLVDLWWSKFKSSADEDSKKRRARQAAQPYPRVRMADRVAKAMEMEDPERIFDSLVFSKCVNLIYGYQNVGKSATAEVIAIVAASGKPIEGMAMDNPRKRKVLIIDLEQPDIAAKKWAPLKPLLDDLGIEVVILGEMYGPVDRNRLWATCRQAAIDGFEMCIIDNLNKFFQGDVTKKDIAEKECDSLMLNVFSHFETNVGVHHTIKLGTGPLETMPEMAGSAQIANYFQGNAVFVALAFRDPDVMHCTHFKAKFGHFYPVYRLPQTLALRRIGFDSDWLPFVFESSSETFQYWQSKPTTKDEQMWELIKHCADKKDAGAILYDAKFSKNPISAVEMAERLLKKFGQS